MSDDDHAALRIIPGSEPGPAADTWIAPAGVRIRELERLLLQWRQAFTIEFERGLALKEENARLRRALEAAGIVQGSDPFVAEVAVEPWDLEFDYA